MTVAYELLRDFSIPVIAHRYVEKDVMLYALGLGLGADPLGSAGVESFEHRQHLGPDSIAAVAEVVVGRVVPHRQIQLLAKPGGVGPGEGQQRPRQRD